MVVLIQVRHVSIYWVSIEDKINLQPLCSADFPTTTLAMGTLSKCCPVPFAVCQIKSKPSATKAQHLTETGLAKEEIPAGLNPSVYSWASRQLSIART